MLGLQACATTPGFRHQFIDILVLFVCLSVCLFEAGPHCTAQAGLGLGLHQPNADVPGVSHYDWQETRILVPQPVFLADEFMLA